MCGLLCHFATKISIQAESIATCVTNLKWYNYPIKYQLYLKLILLRAQRPVAFHGFGIISCNMEIFLAVNKIL